jgi:two-component system sensor histidine kinase YesM
MLQTYIAGVQYIIKSSLISINEWELFILIPVNELVSDMVSIRMTGFLIGVFVSVLVLTIAFIIGRSITTQVLSVSSNLQKINGYGSGFRITTEYNKELNLLVKQINHMLERVDQSATETLAAKDKLYTNELEKRHAQIYALQSQINPHFLYNTLECIRGIALYKDVAEISSISSSMGSIYRYCSSPVEFVSLREELNCVVEYFNVINIRFEGRITLEIDIPDKLMNTRMLKMILQPLVENSVFHGLEKVSHPAFLRITAELNDRIVQIVLTDNGKGMSAEDYERLKKSLETQRTFTENSSVGLANIQRRIKITYGENYGIQIKSRENVGTVVYIRIPADEVQSGS